MSLTHRFSQLVIKDRKRWISTKEDYCKALLQYKTIFGHTLVPSKYVVPSNDQRWPEVFKGAKLGAYTKKYRQLYQSRRISPQLFSELSNVDFAWNISDYKWERRIVPALEMYQKIHGNLRIQNKFKVPAEENWPKTFHGLNLGDIVKNIRAYSCFVQGNAARRQQLNSLGFDWNPIDSKFERILYPSLVLYKKLYGDLSVSQDFVIPAEDPWPKELHGVLLGEIVKTVRSQGCLIRGNIERKEKLDNLSFIWNHYDTRFNDVILPALLTYKEVYGNLRINKGFIVPNSSPWPISAYGLALGETVMSMRSQGTYVHDKAKRERLDEIGFAWSARKTIDSKEKTSLM